MNPTPTKGSENMNICECKLCSSDKPYGCGASAEVKLHYQKREIVVSLFKWTLFLLGLYCLGKAFK